MLLSTEDTKFCGAFQLVSFSGKSRGFVRIQSSFSRFDAQQIKPTRIRNHWAGRLFVMKVASLPSGLMECFRCVYHRTPTTLTPSLQQSASKASTKHFTTSSRLRAGFAAPEIRFTSEGKDGAEDEEGPAFYARLIPESRSYFTAQPDFTDSLLTLEALLQRCSSLPRLKPADAPRIAWRTLPEYRNMVGENVKASKYRKIVGLLQQLNYIHPSLMPSDVKNALNVYKKDINPFQNVARPTRVDKLGRAIGAGRRKTSTAQAWVVEGTGEVLVNGKTLAEAFGRIHDRESAIWALKATDRIDKYNVWAIVKGGGTTGQAEALTLAVGKALIAHEPALKPALRRGNDDIPLSPPHHLQKKKKEADLCLQPVV